MKAPDDPEIDLRPTSNASDTESDDPKSNWISIYAKRLKTIVSEEQFETIQTVATMLLVTLDFASEILLFSQIVRFMCLASDDGGDACCRDISGDAYCEEGSFLWKSTFPRKDSFVANQVCACEGGCGFDCDKSPDMDRVGLRTPYFVAKIFIYADFFLTMTKECYNLYLVLKSLFSNTLKINFLGKPFNLESPSGLLVMILHPKFWKTCKTLYTDQNAQEIMLQLFTEDLWSIIASAILLKWPLPDEEATTFAVLSLIVSLIMLVVSVIRIRKLNS